MDSETLKPHMVVYTAIFGEKDNLLSPEIVPPNCDFLQPTTGREKMWKRLLDRIEADQCNLFVVNNIFE